VSAFAGETAPALFECRVLRLGQRKRAGMRLQVLTERRPVLSIGRGNCSPDRRGDDRVGPGGEEAGGEHRAWRNRQPGASHANERLAFATHLRELGSLSAREEEDRLWNGAILAEKSHGMLQVVYMPARAVWVHLSLAHCFSISARMKSRNQCSSQAKLPAGGVPWPA